MFDKLKSRLQALRAELQALLLALRDPRTPWYARGLIVLVVAYALSPIDLIPDFIPVLGYLDDLLLVPAGVALAVRLIPPQVMAEVRAAALAGDGVRARIGGSEEQFRKIGAGIIVLIWILAIIIFASFLIKWLKEVL
jgi:uncharacterized membrane protein YkvA (DUF1232 family)